MTTAPLFLSRLAIRLTVGCLGMLVAIGVAACDGDSAAPAPVPMPAPPAAAPVEEPEPSVRAEDVVDRETLQAFVERAGATLEASASDLEEAYAFLDANFREEGEWRHGEIYVFVLTLQRINFFQAPDRSLEGIDETGLTDLNGVEIADIIVVAAEAGGGFVDYHWDNPAIEGDEETGSPKTSYITAVTIGETTLALGAGIYLSEGE